MVTKENVAQLINAYYEKEHDPIEGLLKQVAKEMPKQELDIQQVLETIMQNRKALSKNINFYEKELAEITSLSLVLSSEHHNLTKDRYMEYICYLLQSIDEILPDVLELIQLLKQLISFMLMLSAKKMFFLGVRHNI